MRRVSFFVSDKTKGLLVLLLLVTFVSQVPAISYASTTITIYPIADSYVYEWKPNSNFGGDDDLYVTTFTGTQRITYMMFDFSSIPENALNEEIMQYLDGVKPFDSLYKQYTASST